jgi:hypothetical protein
MSRYVRVGYCYNAAPFLAQDQGITEDEWEAWANGEVVSNAPNLRRSRHFDRAAWEADRKREKIRRDRLFATARKSPEMAIHICRKLIEVAILRRASIYRQHEEILANVLRRDRPLSPQLRAELRFRRNTLWEKPKGDALAVDLGVLEGLRALLSVEGLPPHQRIQVKRFNTFMDKLRESNGTPYWVTYDVGSGWIH